MQQHATLSSRKELVDTYLGTCEKVKRVGLLGSSVSGCVVFSRIPFLIWSSLSFTYCNIIILLYQAMKAKAISEGKVHGPRAKQQQLELEGPVEYEPFDFPDGEINIHIHVHIHIYNERN